MAGFGTLGGLRYAVVSTIAVIVVTFFTDRMNLFPERSVNFTGPIDRLPSEAPSGFIDSVSFLGNLLLIPFDIMVLMADLMGYWVQLAAASGIFAPLVLIPGAVIAFTVVLFVVEVGTIMVNAIPLT